MRSPIYRAQIGWPFIVVIPVLAWTQETGAVIMTSLPGTLTRYFRQAHFTSLRFVAGAAADLLSALAGLSATSGLYLSLKLRSGKLSPRS